MATAKKTDKAPKAASKPKAPKAAKETKAKAPSAAKKAAAALSAAPAANVKTGQTALQTRKMVTGIVTSDKMQKTIVVKIDRRVRHELYKKYVTHSHKVKAHDETNSAKIGDLVQIVESRPLSADKRWALSRIIRRAGQAPEANV